MPCKDINLNLLISLDALLKHESVSHAACHLGVSQPTMSQTLKQLRALLQDALLVRHAGKMSCTQLAKDLQPRIRHILCEIENTLITNQPNDPSMYQCELNMTCDDSVATIFLCPHLKELQSLAPGIKINLLNLSPRETIAQLLNGELHLAIGSFSRLPETLYSRELLYDELKLLVRENHPLGHSLLPTSCTLASLPRVNIEDGACWSKIANASLLHQDSPSLLSVSSPLPGIFSLLQTDAYMPVPHLTANFFIEFFPLRIVPLPGETSKITWKEVWGAYHHNNPALRWLRHTLFEKITDSQCNTQLTSHSLNMQKRQ